MYSGEHNKSIISPFNSPRRIVEQSQERIVSSDDESIQQEELSGRAEGKGSDQWKPERKTVMGAHTIGSYPWFGPNGVSRICMGSPHLKYQRSMKRTVKDDLETQVIGPFTVTDLSTSNDLRTRPTEPLTATDRCQLGRCLGPGSLLAAAIDDAVLKQSSQFGDSIEVGPFTVTSTTEPSSLGSFAATTAPLSIDSFTATTAPSSLGCDSTVKANPSENQQSD